MPLDHGLRRASAVVSHFPRISRFLPHTVASHLTALPPPFLPHDPTVHQKLVGGSVGELLDASSVRALIFDKDNTFTAAKAPSVHQSCVLTLADLSSRFKSLVVSNSAGSATDQRDGYRQAAALEDETQIEVLRHATYKPMADILPPIQSWMTKQGLRPDEVCFIGDNVFTDILTANLLRCWSILLIGDVTTNPAQSPARTILQWTFSRKTFQADLVMSADMLGIRPQRPGLIDR